MPSVSSAACRVAVHPPRIAEPCGHVELLQRQIEDVSCLEVVEAFAPGHHAQLSQRTRQRRQMRQRQFPFVARFSDACLAPFQRGQSLLCRLFNGFGAQAAVFGQGGQVVLVHRFAPFHPIHHVRKQAFGPHAPLPPAKLAVGAPGAEQFAQFLATGDRLASGVGQGFGQPFQRVAHMLDALGHKRRFHASHARLRSPGQRAYPFQHPSGKQRIGRRAGQRSPKGNRRSTQRRQGVTNRPSRHSGRRKQPAPPLYRRKPAQQSHDRQRRRHAHVMPAQRQ